MRRKSVKKPAPEAGSDNPNLEEWLGAEAHVRYQKERPGWRETLFVDGPGVAGLTLIAAFVGGLLIGGGVIMLAKPRGSRDGNQGDGGRSRS